MPDDRPDRPGVAGSGSGDELPTLRAGRIGSAVARAAERSPAAGGRSGSLPEALEAVGRAAGADRLYLLPAPGRAGGGPRAFPGHAWSAPGVSPSTPRGEDLAAALGSWAPLLSSGGVVRGPVGSLPPEERPLFAERGVRSFAVLPVQRGDRWWGALILECCADRPAWTPEEIGALRGAAAVLGAAAGDGTQDRPDGPADVEAKATGTARLDEQIRREIGQRRRLEDALRESEEGLRAIFETTAMGIVSSDLHGRILDANPALREMLGYTVEQLRRLSLLDLAHPEEVTHARTLAGRLLRGEIATYQTERRLRRKDGQLIWTMLSASLARDARGRPRYVLRMVQDITDRKRAEQALREAESKYRTLVEQIPAVTYIDRVDPEAPGGAEAVYFSPQIEKMLGYRPEEFIEDPDLWNRILHPEDRETALRRDRLHYQSRWPLANEYRLTARDGRVVWVLDRAGLVRDESGELHSRGVLYDITEHKRAQQDMQRAFDREREAGRRLRAIDEMKTTFLHAVSHELRTPLSAVLGLALTLEREDLQLSPEESRELLGRLSANARKLDRLLSDLLDLDRLDRGILEPKLRAADVSKLVLGVLDGSDLLGDRPLEVSAPPSPAEVDPPKVERMVENLLANAARHTPPGTAVWVKVRPEADGVVIAVEDAGPGVPEPLRRSIFQPFVRGTAAPTHSPGVGVGLSLVARFAGLHGGRAWVQERPGGGASFRVFLPAAGPGHVERPTDQKAAGAP